MTNFEKITRQNIPKKGRDGRTDTSAFILNKFRLCSAVNSIYKELSNNQQIILYPKEEKEKQLAGKKQNYAKLI